jgi:hypothetical protein
MKLKEYFKNTKGFGVLSTADEEGKVDSAVYANPHVVDDAHVAFIMSDRLSHANITKNPHVVYLFKEEGPGYAGKRLYLKKEKESDDQELIKDTCKAEWPGPYCNERYLKGTFLVYFTVESVLPLVVYDGEK